MASRAIDSIDASHSWHFSGLLWLLARSQTNLFVWRASVMTEPLFVSRGEYECFGLVVSEAFVMLCCVWRRLLRHGAYVGWGQRDDYFHNVAQHT